jgi:hypothetical protein
MIAAYAGFDPPSRSTIMRLARRAKNDRSHRMRRPVSILLAAALAAASAMAVSSPSAAAPRLAPPAAAGTSVESGILKAHDPYRYQRRHHRRQQSHYRRPPPFVFGFHFGPQYQYRYHRQRQQDCFRTWDGRVYCRGY